MTDPVLETPVNDCWNRIGVRGDGSCPSLTQYIRCLNCPVFERGAAELLDRQPLRLEEDGLSASGALERAAATLDARGASRDATMACLLFRIGPEWFAWPARHVQSVLAVRTVHSIPHRQHHAVLGLVNVRGELRLCLSLARLLGFEETTPTTEATDGMANRNPRRLIDVRWEGFDAVFPVDRIDGVHRLRPDSFRAPPDTLPNAPAGHTQAVLPWNGVSLSVLDPAAVFSTLNGSLE